MQGRGPRAQAIVDLGARPGLLSQTTKMTFTSKQARRRSPTRDFQVGLPARRAAVELLDAVLGKKQPLGEVLSRSLDAGPMFDLPTCLSKFLHLGMAFPEVIRAATARPAEVLGLQNQIGTLRPGALADVALCTIQRGRFPLYDIHMNMRECTQLIRNTLTIVNGRPLPPALDHPPAPWIELSEAQRDLIERCHTPAAFAHGDS